MKAKELVERIMTMIFNGELEEDAEVQYDVYEGDEWESSEVVEGLAPSLNKKYLFLKPFEQGCSNVR